MAPRRGRSTWSLDCMSTDTARRVRNMLAWAVGALLCQASVVGIASWRAPDPAYSRSATFEFGELFGLAGCLAGLLGYALFAAFRASSATSVASLVAGAIFSVAMLASSFAIGYLLPDPFSLLVSAAVWVTLGALSYALAYRMQSN